MCPSVCVAWEEHLSDVYITLGLYNFKTVVYTGDL